MGLRASRVRAQGWLRRAATLVLPAVLAFVVVGELRTEPGVTERLELESEQDLTRIFAGLNEEAAALRDEITELRIKVQLLESSAESDEVARESTEREVRQLEVLAGLVPAVGPGVVLRIDDPFQVVTFDIVLDVVQELRNARAEAVAVNGRRIGAASFVDQSDGEILLDGAEIEPPFVIQAIGDPATLEGGLTIPGGAVDGLRALTRVEVTVERQSAVQVPALTAAPEFRTGEPIDE